MFLVDLDIILNVHVGFFEIPHNFNRIRQYFLEFQKILT